MSSEWLITIKPTFQTEWLALPPKIAHQILEKIHYLTQDPLPDGDLKKQLTHINRDIYRLESGDYRIMYTLQHPYISLLRLEKRQESTYKGEFKSEYLGGYNPEETLSERVDKYTREGAAIPSSRALPSPITKELLVNLLIPAQYHADLLAIDNVTLTRFRRACTKWS